MPTGKEIPSHILEASYWDGHTFVNPCDLIHQQTPSTIPKENLLRYVLRETNFDRFSKTILLDYIRIANKPSAVRVFKKGTVFDGHNFPPGTIIKMDTEKLFEPKNPIYLPSIKWGVICGYEKWPPQTRALVTYSDYFVSPKRIHYIGRTEDCVINVGDVTHTISNYSYYKGESLHRVNWLEVCQYGQGMPVKAEVKALVGKFIPVFNR